MRFPGTTFASSCCSLVDALRLAASNFSVACLASPEGGRAFSVGSAAVPCAPALCLRSGSDLEVLRLLISACTTLNAASLSDVHVETGRS